MQIHLQALVSVRPTYSAGGEQSGLIGVGGGGGGNGGDQWGVFGVGGAEPQGELEELVGIGEAAVGAEGDDVEMEASENREDEEMGESSEEGDVESDESSGERMTEVEADDE